ncbi:hypothetical protein OKA04_10460 [Luteolibacter flavescens]|uniref:Uncharacterized protein n=1 Tax=Luteolibacter flavescens TaxID=1859460 RepID=A0ABT3FNK0_9BACT|nr:hypothetical protein [Luteolibacter flavescens]MCW1885150.1 hypothetical protein [Luteolibacter flavescens]
MKRRFIDRLHDRLWLEWSSRKTTDTLGESGQAGREGSVSGTMAWPDACAVLARGGGTSRGFRRERAVREVVETLGPSDGRYHARRILTAAPELLRDPRVRAVNSWGDPVLWPALLLGTPAPYSPTTLRYLSHALWLRDHGLVKQGGTIVEIGVGYGGLAAMNAIVSGARTTLADLPPVTEAAMKMLGENGLAEFATPATDSGPDGDYCVISNYAFTELTGELQDHYIGRYLRASTSGMIVSNANVFARSIGGRDDNALVAALHAAGIPARLDPASDLLGPSDHLGGVTLITWTKPS